MRRHSTSLAIFVSLGLVVGACGGGDGTTTTEAPVTTVPAGLPTGLDAATFTVQPGVWQVAVLDATPDDEVAVLDATTGETMVDGVVDANGVFLARGLLEGEYAVRVSGASDQLSEVVEVLAPSDHPDQEFYDVQALGTDGLTYIEARDGTLLSATAWLPGPADGGPYPTVVEYSGYAPSNPNDSTFAQLFNALGYAYVGVNMRGSGCSGGSYRFFETTQHTDGYDAVEAVAAQPWVRNNKVGMVGISYPGISQLYVAAQQPPNLLAITPLSVIEDSYRSTLYPGGILNTGFAVEWTQDRMDQTEPYGQGWEQGQVDAGDETCAANQKMRLQNPDLVAEIGDNPYYRPDFVAELAPRSFVGNIEVPTFLAGAWQDEQTGGRFPEFIPQFTGTDDLYVTLVNGLHTESLSPSVFDRYIEFLDLFVKEQVPSLGGARIVGPILAASIWGTDDISLPEDRFEGMSYDEALAEFRGEPRVKVLFEQGAADGRTPGAPMARFTQSFDTWPIPGVEATTWYLGAGGRLTSEAPTDDSEPSSYTADPGALPGTFYAGGGSSAIWRADVEYDWQAIPEGKGLVFTSDPLVADTVMIGSGSADLWISSDADDTDLEVTVIEVRPDGSEYYVQSGWLRASHRALDEAASSALSPVHTHLESDAAPLTPGELTPVRVQIFPFAHPFRAGSRLRITIDAPGNNRPVWSFVTLSDGERVSIAHNADHPSAIVLSVVPGVKVPPGVPACPSLRGQPCRPG
jgi:uncharacterized protein